MALKATIFKASVTVSDMDRNYYNTHALTLARHPSETDERMMVRLLAFALHAGERLEFGKGVSEDDEPALWRKDFEADRNTRPARYYKWWNEVPTALMIGIVFLVVLKPF